MFAVLVLHVASAPYTPFFGECFASFASLFISFLFAASDPAFLCCLYMCGFVPFLPNFVCDSVLFATLILFATQYCLRPSFVCDLVSFALPLPLFALLSLGWSTTSQGCFFSVFFVSGRPKPSHEALVPWRQLETVWRSFASPSLLVSHAAALVALSFWA